MTNELGGKERADTSQRGPSKAPPTGHWQRKPPSGPSAQVPPLRQTPGTQRPASVSSSQSSPRGTASVRGGHDQGQVLKGLTPCGHAPIQSGPNPARLMPRPSHDPARSTTTDPHSPASVHGHASFKPQPHLRPLGLGGPRLSQGQALLLVVSPRPTCPGLVRVISVLFCTVVLPSGSA